MSTDTSRIGRYQPPGPDTADGYVRESVHVSMADGCRIAVDVLHPARGGEPLGGARPTVLHATPYRRAFVLTGRARTASRYTQAFRELGLGAGDLVTQYEARPLARRLLHQGYNFVSMDIRGTGASFGAKYQDNWRTGHDIGQVVEWITRQPWATDKVGMVGISYEGMVQLSAACFAPPGLACIAPQYPGHHSCIMDGGLAIRSFARTWETLHQSMSAEEPAAPVDGPEGLELRAEAESERDPNRYAWVEHFTRADPAKVTRLAVWDAYAARKERPDLGLGEVTGSVMGVPELLNAGGVPVHLSTGWWDLTFPGYIARYYEQLTVPKKLLLGPWNHGQGGDPELLRWLDYWLKGVGDGVLDEPPVLYAATRPSGDVEWRACETFPPPEAEVRTLHLTADAALSEAAPADANRVAYAVDPEVTLGPLSRHSFYIEDLHIDTVDLTERAQRCLTFDTEPLDRDAELTGFPVLELEIETSAACGAIVATLEHVLEGGDVAYLTEGFVNLEHRKEREGGDSDVRHSLLTRDIEPVIPGAPMRVRVELYPVSALVRAGERLRLTIAGADADNLVVPDAGPAASLAVSIGGESGARLGLPIVRGGAETRVVEGAFTGSDAHFAFRRPGDPTVRG